MTTDTLQKLALAAYEAEQEKEKIERQQRVADLRERAMIQLRRITGLEVVPTDVDGTRFKWQGYWWNVEGDRESEYYEYLSFYCWDMEEGWCWRGVYSLVDIGEHMADLADAEVEANSTDGGKEPQYLPDGYFAVPKELVG